MIYRKPPSSPVERRLLGRREFLSALSILGAASAAGVWAPALGGRRLWAAEGASGLIVETTGGKVRGRIERGVHSFKGIYYGASTGGRNRFRPPAKRTPWAGVMDALEYGASAPQARGGAFAGDEDCLVLNLWSRGLGDGGKRPVMVWLHGGGFSSGSGSSATYDGTNLCLGGDVVVVTVNHRLNAFGATYLAAAGDADFADSGCVGMLDVVAALEWVRDNIESFGGDPDRVLIFGESGGGRKVSVLLGMPAAKGLFHRAVIESGAVLRVTAADDGTRAAEGAMARLGLRPNQISELQQVPAERFLAASNAALAEFTPHQSIVGTTGYTPVLDGRSIPAHPFDPTATEISADVPVIVGWNRTEETLFARGDQARFDLDREGLQERIASRLADPKAAAHVVSAYTEAHPDASPWDLYILIATDHPRGIYPRELATRKAALGRAAIYVYRFDWEIDDVMRAAHALEIRFVFDNIDHAEPRLFDMKPSPEAFALADSMSAAWMAFARTGDPNTPSLPQWPAYSGESRHTMLFDNESRVESDPERDLRVMMEEILGLT